MKSISSQAQAQTTALAQRSTANLQQRSCLSTSLHNLIDKPLENGQKHLAQLIRVLIYKDLPELYEQLPYGDDDFFLHPYLFAHFTSKQSKDNLRTLIHQLRNICLQATPDSGNGIINMAGKRLLVSTLPHKVLHSYFPNIDSNYYASATPFDVHLSALRRSLRLLMDIDSQLFRWIIKSTQLIQLFNGKSPNSFATLSAHGAAFLNTYYGSDRVFFLDDLAHQCGHIIFNAVTWDKEQFFEIPYNTSLGHLLSNSNETRTFYSAFHGLFTYTLITRVLDRAYFSDRLTAREKQDVIGRLAFYLGKFSTDLESLSNEEYYTATGTQYFQHFEQSFMLLRQRHHSRISKVSLSNQGYVYQSTRFSSANPRK